MERKLRGYKELAAKKCSLPDFLKLWIQLESGQICVRREDYAFFGQ